MTYQSLTVAALLGGALFLGGCSGWTATPESLQPTPVETTPDASKLDLAVNYGFQTNAYMNKGALVVPVFCGAGVEWQGTFYVVGANAMKDEPNLELIPAEPLDGVVIPGCNDTGGNLESDTPTDAWSIQGVDPQKAILVKYP